MLLPDLVEAQTDPPSSGDWTVSDRTIVENRTVQLRGNLTITAGGSLTLRNVTLKVFCGPTDTFGITVASGGTLMIEDIDGLGSTSGDGSVLMRGAPSWGYHFVAMEGSNLSIKNSSVSGPGGRIVSQGVLVETDNATFEGVDFIDGDAYGLRIQGTSGARIMRCSFYLAGNGLMLIDAANASVRYCEFVLNYRAGVLMNNATNIILADSNMSQNNLNGLVITGSTDIWVYDSLFSENIRGIVLNSVEGLILEDCQVNMSRFDGLVIEGAGVNITVVNTSIFDNGRSGIEGKDVTNLSLEDCIIHNCTYFGVRLVNWTEGFDMKSCRVSDNGYDGVHIENARAIDFNGNQVYSNGYNGVFIINSEAFFIKNDTYHSNGYDGINCDHVHGFSVDSSKSHNNTYNGIYLQAGTNLSVITRCGLMNNTRGGIELNSAFDVEVWRCNISQNLDFGIRVEMGAFNILISESTISDNVQGGLRLRNSHSIRANNLSIVGGGDHVAVLVEASWDVWMTASFLLGVVEVTNFGNATIVSPISEVFIPRVTGGSWLDMAYWVQVEVVWPDDTPVDGAFVYISSVNGTRWHAAMTDPLGRTEVIPVTIRTWDGGPAIERNPTTFHVKKGIEAASKRLTITNDTLVRIVLEDAIPPVPMMEDVVAELGALTLMDGSASYDNGLLVSWEWTFDDGVGTVVLVGPTASWTFNVLGTFSGQLNVTDSVGLWNTTTFTIRVVDTTAPLVVLGDDILVNQNTYVDLNGTGTTDNDSTLIITGRFKWSIFKDGDQAPVHTATGPLEVYVFVDMGEYVVVLVVTDQSGNSGNASHRVTVRDNTPPVVDAGSDKYLDQGLPITLEPAQVTDNDPAFDPINSSVRWRIQGPGLDQNLTGYSIQWTSPDMGVYQAIVYVSDAAGNVGTDALVITVWDTVQPWVDLGEDHTVNMTTIVTIGTTGVTDNDPAFPEGASYIWSVSGPHLVLDLKGREVSFQVPWVGTYTVILSVTDATGNMGQDTLKIVSEDPWAPTFGAFYPPPEDLAEHGDLVVIVSITDQGMGVNPDLVEMRMRMPSHDVWGTWTLVDAGVSTRFVEATIHLELPEGTTLIQFRCWDLAGNGPALSPEHPVRVNSRPAVVVLSPTDGADYGPYDEIWLDASPTHDPDVEDVLTFLWTSDVDGPLGSMARVRAPKLSPGEHQLSILVSDGVDGHEVMVTVTVTVAPEPSTVSNYDSIPWYIMLLILLLLLGTVYVIWDARRKRQRPPPAILDDQGEEWVETPSDDGEQAPGTEPRAGQLNTKTLTVVPFIEGWVI